MNPLAPLPIEPPKTIEHLYQGEYYEIDEERLWLWAQREGRYKMTIPERLHFDEYDLIMCREQYLDYAVLEDRAELDDYLKEIGD